MLIKLRSVVFSGISTISVDIEVNVANRGFPTFEIVGLPNKSIAESKERIRTALVNSGIAFPNKKITVNLAPADLPKHGSMYDFPIAVGIIAFVYDLKVPDNSIFFGELSLDGNLRYTNGVFLLSIFAKEHHIRDIFVPISSSYEARTFRDINAFGISNLREFVSFLNGQRNLLKINDISYQSNRQLNIVERNADFSQILGQEFAKRALEIAAAGGHSIFMLGPPGSGKTMLARAFKGILPDMSEAESIEVTKIHSCVGKIATDDGLIKDRVFRCPHHGLSYIGMLGGGAIPMPGEISLAHNGVLFLDEFGEFKPDIIEALRQPIEDGFIDIVRHSRKVRYPCKFLLVAAANPCPCGFKGSSQHICSCSQREIFRYEKNFSGPMLDRIDIFINLSPVKMHSLISFKSSKNSTNDSNAIRSRVIAARELQILRNGCPNSELNNEQVSTSCVLTDTAKALLFTASTKLGLSARSYFKILKVALTISDLDSSSCIHDGHVAEALQYRKR